MSKGPPKLAMQRINQNIIIFRIWFKLFLFIIIIRGRDNSKILA